MRLAAKLGYASPRRMLQEMDSAEWLDWQAFDRIQPFGDEWRQSAMIAASIINGQRRKGAAPIEWEALMPLPARQMDGGDEVRMRATLRTRGMKFRKKPGR